MCGRMRFWWGGREHGVVVVDDDNVVVLYHDSEAVCVCVPGVVMSQCFRHIVQIVYMCKIASNRVETDLNQGTSSTDRV